MTGSTFSGLTDPRSRRRRVWPSRIWPRCRSSSGSLTRTSCTRCSCSIRMFQVGERPLKYLNRYFFMKHFTQIVMRCDVICLNVMTCVEIDCDVLWCHVLFCLVMFVIRLCCNVICSDKLWCHLFKCDDMCWNWLWCVVMSCVVLSRDVCNKVVL